MAGPLAASSAPAAETEDVSGMWWASSYSPSIKSYLVGGGDVPLNDAGRKKYLEIQAGLKDGSITDRARKYCTPDAIPRALATPYPLHVVDRYKLIEGGKRLQGMLTVEDPGTFTTKWSGLHYFIKHNLPIAGSESICAENNDANYFGEEQVPIPQTKTPDF
jgi:hypothetical protein